MPENGNDPPEDDSIKSGDGSEEEADNGTSESDQDDGATDNVRTGPNASSEGNSGNKGSTTEQDDLRDHLFNNLKELDDDTLSALQNKMTEPDVEHEVTTGDILGFVLSGIGIGLSVGDSRNSDGDSSADLPRSEPPDVTISGGDNRTYSLNRPEEGETDWHIPLNENFDLLENNPPPLTVDRLEQLRSSEPTEGQLALVQETSDLYVGEEEEWALVGRVSYYEELSKITEKINEIEEKMDEIYETIQNSNDN